MRRRMICAALALAFALQMVVVVSLPVYGGTTGIISGVVADSATGEKLAGVNIIVEGTDLTTVTDSNGYYVITNVPPGDYKVTASLVGYSDARAEKVSVLMDVTATVNFSMEQAVAEEEEVVVTESRPMIQKDMVPTMYVVDQHQEKMVRSQPQFLYQAPGLVATQPGVVSDAEGYPHIRGGRVNQVNWMLDGIPITEPLTNSFGTNAATVGMDKMEIYTGGYRPEYGNAISGVFNQVVKSGRNFPGVSLEVIGGSNAFKGVYPEIGGATPNGLDYYVGAYLWHSEFERLQYNEADCADMIGKFTYPMNNRNKLTLLVANGSAKYQFPSVHTYTYGTSGLVEIPPERDHQHQSYSLTALTLNHTINSKSFFTLRSYLLTNKWQVDAISDDIGYWWDAKSETFGLQFDYTNQLSPKHLLKAGAIRMVSDNNYWATVPAYGDYEYTANTDTVQTGLYLQDQMTLNDRWSAEVGLRYDRMKYDKVVNPDTSESQLSPRLGLAYVVDPKTRLRCSWGKMIQFVYTQAIERNYTNPVWNEWYGLGNADLRPERSSQFDIGWEREVAKDCLLQITPFYRKFVDLLQVRSINPEDPTAPPFVYDNLGEGTSKGVEIMFKKRPSNNWSGWLAYTWSVSKAQASNDRETVTPGVMQYVDWDQRHTAVLVLNYMNKGWSYSLMGEYGSGLPYNLADEPVNSRRVSPHLVFNLSIMREITGGWLPQGQMYLHIGNLFNVGGALDRGEDGEPTAWISPRFVSMGYVRKF
ncbi:MAG: TonB-dependent receptor [Armatimonadota bacterium]|nr:TonB-dependent receptor [Armatimonadota bacterium]